MPRRHSTKPPHRLLQADPLPWRASRLSSCGVIASPASAAVATVRAAKADEEEALQVSDGEFSFPKNQTMYRHHGGVLEV